jgi:hypothetical protein
MQSSHASSKVSRMQRSKPLFAACFAGTLAAASPALGGAPDRAEILFNRGVEDMEARQFETGCPAIEESYRLDPRPGTLFTLAECEALRGHIATAVARYDEYLGVFAKLSPDKQRKQRDREKTSRAQKAALGPEIPELTLTLPPDAPEGTAVKRDGAELAPASLGAAIPVDPGEHVVTTQAPGGPVTELRVTIGRGDRKTLQLKVKRAKVDAPIAAPGSDDVTTPTSTSTPTPSSPSPERPSGRRVGAYAVLSLGLAGLAVGGVMGALALGEKSVVTRECMDKACSPEGKAAADRLKTFGLASTIGFSAGGAGVVVATVLIVTEPSPPKASRSIARAPTRWLRAGVLSAGPSGTMVGLGGGW